MSFMFNPHPYNDMTPINRPKLSKETIDSVICGTKETAKFLSDVLEAHFSSNPALNCCIIAMDGYISAQWEQTINLVTQNLSLKSIDVIPINIDSRYKSSLQLEEEFEEYLPADRVKDPVLLFGKLFKGGFEEIFDMKLVNEFRNSLEKEKTLRGSGKKVIVVYGCGCTIKELRSVYDYILYFDVTPKETILRARNGLVKNLGDVKPRPIKELLRRCYYIDFEVAGHLRGELLKNNEIDYYIASDKPLNHHLIPRDSLNEIFSSLVRYPFRCKPVYLEGVWGGHYIKRLRSLPDNMRNCAWVFDLIPLEVSILVAVGETLVEFPYFTFVQKEDVALMGEQCVKKFNGYFPVRFNYDDTYHSNGNMSIQVHPTEDYIIENHDEHGRQDESYYVVATGHGAKTYLGFKEEADVTQFIKEVKRSETEFTPVDHEKYVNSVPSKPGTQFMIPAGTIHSSGRNQVVLEIGSLTVGSYTYKLYDYLRADLDGIPRPIHTYHGERVLKTDRRTTWVKENLVQEPRLVRSGQGWAEYIVGEHDLIYFSLRRLEFENSIEDDTAGKFHVLTLVDGESVLVHSLDNPEICYRQNYLDIVVVPANIGKYVIKNLGNQPVCIHKTMLKDGFYEK